MSEYNETTKFCTSDDILEENWYDILGCNVKSSQEDIEDAFRVLAKQYHPDKNKDPKAIEMFYKISNAYQILSDREVRAFYDYESGNLNEARKMYRFRAMDDIVEFKYYIDDLCDNQISNSSFNDAIWELVKLKIQPVDSKKEFNLRKNIVGTLDVVRTDLAKGIRTAFPLFRYKTCGVCRGFGKIGIDEREICYNCDGYGIEEERIFVYVEIPKNYNCKKKFIVPGRGHKLPITIGDLVLTINPVNRLAMKTKIFQSNFKNRRF